MSEAIDSKTSEKKESEVEKLKDANTTIGIGIGVGTLGVCAAVVAGAT